MAYHAARRSFVPYLTELIAFAVGLVVAFALFDPVGQFIHTRLGVSEGVAGFGSFLLLLVVAHAVVQAPVGYAAGFLARQLRPWLSPNVYMGISAVPALGVGAMLSMVLLSAFAVLPVAQLSGLARDSLLGSTIVARATFLQSPMQKLLVPNKQQHQILESIPANNPGQDAFYKLQFPPDLKIEVDPAAEEMMLQRINQARAQAGVSALRMDALLREAARRHSEDMYKRHYFSHRTPEGKTPYDRLKDLRFHYVTAGENLAFAPDVDQAWDALMKSPDHRANILNPDFRCVGVGAYRGLNGYEMMFTQDFADCS